MEGPGNCSGGGRAGMGGVRRGGRDWMKGEGISQSDCNTKTS